MNPFEQLLNTVGRGYREADKRLGGWLPGGGTASPVTRAVQTTAPAARRLAGSVRDNAIIPVIDKGIETGILPTKEAMFARYLTGTNKPLTTYPQTLLNQISTGSNQALIEHTRFNVDNIFRQTNPSFRNYVSIPRNVLSDEERLNIIQQNNLVQPDNTSISPNYAYSVMPREVQLSLGSFNIEDGTIKDKYRFDDLQEGRRQIPGWGNVYPDAAGGGKLGSDLIELGLKTGILNPNSGYNIAIPFKN